MVIAKLVRTSAIATTLPLVAMGASRVMAPTTVYSKETSRLHHYGDKGSNRRLSS